VSVLEKLTLATYEPGQLIIKQGMPVSAFYIIKEGTIAVRKDGEALTLKELTAGQWFGESEVKSTKPSGANVIAKVPWRADFSRVRLAVVFTAGPSRVFLRRCPLARVVADASAAVPAGPRGVHGDVRAVRDARRNVAVPAGRGCRG
jgi:hypothetical protein